VRNPCIRPVDGGPWTGSQLPVQSVKALTALQLFPQMGALRLGLGIISQRKFKNLTEVRSPLSSPPVGGLQWAWKMTVERVRAWIQKIPKVERDAPIIRYRGKYWTPDEILREVEAGTPTGRELQKMLEMRAYGFVDLRELAKVRLLRKLELVPVRVSIWAIGMPPELSAKDLKKSIEVEDFLGKSLIDAELWIMQNIINQY